MPVFFHYAGTRIRVTVWENAFVVCSVNHIDKHTTLDTPP